MTHAGFRDEIGITKGTQGRPGSAKAMGTFREKACARYGWEPGNFVSKTLRHCVRPWQLPLVWMAWPWRRRIYAADLQLIERVAEMTSYNDIYHVAQDFADSRRARNFVRDFLGIRPHGRRLLAMARDSMPGKPRGEAGGGEPVERRQPDREGRAERQQDEHRGHQRTARKTMAMTATLSAISNA